MDDNQGDPHDETETPMTWFIRKKPPSSTERQDDATAVGESIYVHNSAAATAQPPGRIVSGICQIIEIHGQMIDDDLISCEWYDYGSMIWEYDMIMIIIWYDMIDEICEWYDYGSMRIYDIR